LIKAYLNVRENDTIMKIYDRLVSKEKFKPNQIVLDMVFSTCMRLADSDRIAQLLEKYIECKKIPANYLMN